MNNSLLVHDAPAIAGLHFRGFRGEVDYPHMVAVGIAAPAARRSRAGISLRQGGIAGTIG